MSRRRHPVYKTLLVMAADLFAIGAGLIFAYWLRFESGFMTVTKGFDPADYLWLLPWAWVIWFLALRFENLYRRKSKIVDFNVIRRIVTGSFLALLFLFAFVFAVRRVTDFSRVLIPVVYGSVAGALILERMILARVFDRLTRERFFGLTRTAVIGSGPLAARVYETILRHPESGMAAIGLVSETAGRRAEIEKLGLPALGALEDLGAILAANKIEEVILAEPDLERDRIPGIFSLCEDHLASFRIVPDLTELLFSGMTVETVQGIPMLGARETPLQGWNAAMKRSVDVAAAGAGLALLSPALAVIAWLVKRQDGGPVFYIQDRMGIDGRRFKIVKFRTMVEGAEEATGPVFADDNDDRCTRLGLVLRKYRLDELPQLVNVLMGEMSLVGPRPERPYFIEQFRGSIPHYMARHHVKSGITGWAQINGLCGKHGSIADRLKYDLYYIENWSLWFDVKILFMTLRRASGAN